MRRRLTRLPFWAVWAALASLPPASPVGAVEIEHWTTEQGAGVYYVHRPQLPMVDIRLTFDAGSARDGAAHGLASLAAQMLNRGAGGLDFDTIVERFDNVGAQYSAWADRDMTGLSLRTLVARAYFEPAFDTFLTVLARPDFPRPEFERLRKQVVTGIDKRRQDPGTLAGIAFARAIYGDHPYAHPTGGERDTVAAIRPEDARAFYRRYLVARNLGITIVGDVARARAEVLAARIARALPEGAQPPPLPPLPTRAAPRERRIAFESEQAHVYIGRPSIGYGDADFFPLYLGNHILGGGGFGSRLVEEVRVAGGYAYSIWSGFSRHLAGGAFLAGFQTRSDQVDEALALTRGVIADFVRAGPSAEELALAKDNIRGGFPLRISDNGQIVQWVSRMAFFDLGLDYLDTFVDKIERTEAQDIGEAFRRRIGDDFDVVIVGD